jgi:uncharacterized protein YbjT (DUF2867 family)
MRMDRLVLVTGATGYIASRLIPRLLEAGYRVRCLARDPRRLTGRSWSHQVEIVQGDVTVPSTLVQAMEGVHTAYYLIHNMSHGHGYTALELDSARSFTNATAEAGVQHIIYLGGLADPEQHIAPHMRSRIETGRVLREGKVPVTEFRAGVIAGSGSISFEMIRFMTELFPIVPGPTWMKNHSQPIAMQNVIDYLFAALTNPNGQGGIFEIGGPDITTYGDLMLRYARLRGLKRSMFLLPGLPLWFMAFGVGLMTPVPYPIAYALIGGLSADSVVKHPEALKAFPEVTLIDFNSATEAALEQTHPARIERVWLQGRNPGSRPETSAIGLSLKHEGCFIDYRELQVSARLTTVLDTIQKVTGKSLDSTEVQQADDPSILFERDLPGGKEWMEWRITTKKEDGHVSCIAQTVFFRPKGPLGFLYGIFLSPVSRVRFRSLIRRITSS